MFRKGMDVTPVKTSLITITGIADFCIILSKYAGARNH